MNAPDDLERLPPARLAEMVRALRREKNRLLTEASPTPDDAQLRRTSLLTQLAIEYRESLDLQSIVDQTLRALIGHLVLSNASIIIVAGSAAVELASTVVDGIVQPMDAELADTVISRGLGGWVLHHGSSVVLGDVAEDQRWLNLNERHRRGSALVVPIRQATSSLGVLTVQRSAPHAFTSNDLILLEGVAAQLGVALGAARVHVGERQRRDQALALLAITRFLTSDHSPSDLAGLIQEQSEHVFGASLGLLYLVEDADAAARLVLVQPESGAVDVERITRAGASARLAWAGRRTVTTAPVPGETCVALPLNDHGRMIGVFVLLIEGKGSFTSNAWSLLTAFTNVLAATCASMLQVSRLTEQARILETLVAERNRQIQRSRDVLRTIFDSLPEGIVLLDEQERLVAANHVFCEKILGLHPREVVGQSYTHVWQTLEQQASVSVNLSADGSGRHLHVSGSNSVGRWLYRVERMPIYDDEGRVEQSVEFWRAEPRSLG
jgi:PAS domain S-box-containing protein